MSQDWRPRRVYHHNHVVDTGWHRAAHCHLDSALITNSVSTSHESTAAPLHTGGDRGRYYLRPNLPCVKCASYNPTSNSPLVHRPIKGAGNLAEHSNIVIEISFYCNVNFIGRKFTAAAAACIIRPTRWLSHTAHIYVKTTERNSQFTGTSRLPSGFVNMTLNTS
jgi:hypothetical protein